MNKISHLDSEKIISTINTLEKRIDERFPDSSLKNVCSEFYDFSKKSKSYIHKISKPNLTLRISAYLIIFLGITGLIYSITYVDLTIHNTKLTNIVALSESIFNDLIILGAAIFFLITIEAKTKRKRAIKRLNELRVFAHVIDMHQLTKDPSIIDLPKSSTESSPKRTLSKFELERYLNYCSELTALISKVAALYAQSLPDDIVVRAVNEIEILCTGHSRKIWQKLIILNEKSKVDVIEEN